MKIVLEKKRDWNTQLAWHSKLLPRVFRPEDLSGYFGFGTFDFVENCKAAGATTFCDTNFLQWSIYAPWIGPELLNSEYILIPSHDISRLKYKIFGLFGVDCKIFVRPNSAKKVFDGQIVDLEEVDKVSPDWGDQLAVISSPKDILGEWRFAVTKDEILGFSLYRYQGNFTTISSCPPDMLDYVKNICKQIPWTDPAITIDIAQLKDLSFKVIECNALSTSGLYAMKPEKIVEYISQL